MPALTFHCDPGHGWLQVGISELRDVDLNPRDFSDCSYRRRNEFYLEEDCDAPKFIDAYEKKHGKVPEFVEVHSNSDSFIRRLPRITD